MSNQIKQRKLNRTSSHRKALLRNLTISLVEHGTIKTTLAKAKEVRPFVEKLITTAKNGVDDNGVADFNAVRALKKALNNKETVKKLFYVYDRHAYLTFYRHYNIITKNLIRLC